VIEGFIKPNLWVSLLVVFLFGVVFGGLIFGGSHPQSPATPVKKTQ